MVADNPIEYLLVILGQPREGLVELLKLDLLNPTNYILSPGLNLLLPVEGRDNEVF